MGNTRRVRIVAVAMLVTVVAAACSPPPGTLPAGPSTDGLRVMTYNVLGAQADAAVFSEHAGWAARIDQLRPDVVVLQEAQSDDVSAALNLTTTDYVLASYLQWECDVKPSREGVAILVRSSVGVLGGGGRHVGASCVDPGVRRVLVWADLDLDSGPLRVYGTHLTAGTGAAAESRLAQIDAIRQVIAQDDPADARRWVWAGDLNVDPGTEQYRRITGDSQGDPGAPRYLDTFAEAHPDAADPDTCPAYAASDVAGLQRLWADPELVRSCGYTAGWPKDSNWLACDLLSLCVSWEARRDTSVRTRIDYVLRAAGGPVQVLGTYVPNRADEGWAAPGAEWYRLSDHLPYVVDLGIG